MLAPMARRGPKLRILATSVALALLAPGEAAADAEAPAACGNPAHPWVQIAVAGGSWDAGAIKELLRHMQAELSAQEIDVCERHASGRKPIAYVQVTPDAATRNVDIAIDV